MSAAAGVGRPRQFPRMGPNSTQSRFRDQQKTQLIEKILAEAPSIAKPLLPHHIITKVATSYDTEVRIILFDGLKQFETASEKLKTSCVNTMAVVSHLLLGRDKSMRLMNLLASHLTLNIEGSYSFRGLFAPDNLNGLMRLKPATDALMKFEAVKTQVDSFKDYVDFPFHKPAFDSLKRELEENGKNLSQEQSFGYFISLAYPFSGVETGILDQTHAFTIEQFYDEKTKAPRFRIYQSCVDQATLGEDLKKQESKSVEEINEFIGKLETYFSKRESTLECFGYKMQSVPFFVQKGNLLSGATIQYVCQPFKPAEIVDHVKELHLLWI